MAKPWLKFFLLDAVVDPFLQGHADLPGIGHVRRDRAGQLAHSLVVGLNEAVGLAVGIGRRILGGDFGWIAGANGA